jgi:O-antigen/teichoic acid export membrane protein
MLDPSELGVYALCFRAVLLGGILPAYGVFLPAQNLLVTLPKTERLGLMSCTLKLGAPTGVISAIAVSLWVLLAPPDVPRPALIALSVTGVAAAFFSPVQDHVRRMLHLSGASRVAALVSIVQCVTVTAAILLCIVARVPVWWVPFGALAFANLASAAVGLRHANIAGTTADASAALRREEIRRSGRWLVFLALLDAGSIFAVAALVASIAGAASLGYAEAARIAANPVMVLALGLSAVLGPRSVRAGRNLEAEQARTISRKFARILAGAGVASLAVFTTGWWGNPMAWLLPTAYEFPGLVGLSILAFLASGFYLPFWSELLGGRLERSIAKSHIISNTLRIVLAGTASLTHAYAVPLSLLGFSLTQVMGFHRARMVMYRRGATPQATI